MNRQQRREVAKKIAQLEKSNNQKNISENFESEIKELIHGCSLEDLMEIDEIIMKKYLTN